MTGTMRTSAGIAGRSGYDLHGFSRRFSDLERDDLVPRCTARTHSLVAKVRGAVGYCIPNVEAFSETSQGGNAAQVEVECLRELSAQIGHGKSASQVQGAKSV